MAANAALNTDVNSARLLLSHGTFIGASTAATALSITLLIIVYTIQTKLPSNLIEIAMGWSVASCLLSVWIIYSIYTVWMVSLEFPEAGRIFKSAGYLSLIAIVLFTALVNFASCRLISKKAHSLEAHKARSMARHKGK